MWPCRPEWPMACLTQGAGKILNGMLRAKPCRTAATLNLPFSLHTSQAIYGTRLRSRLQTSSVPSSLSKACLHPESVPVPSC